TGGDSADGDVSRSGGAIRSARAAGRNAGERGVVDGVRPDAGNGKRNECNGDIEWGFLRRGHRGPATLSRAGGSGARPGSVGFDSADSEIRFEPGKNQGRQ